MSRDLRLFTPDEVNALIPKLEMIMERMQKCGLALRQEMEGLAAELGMDADQVEIPELLTRRPQVEDMVREIDRLTGEIHTCGGQFKGFDLGLVDFPAEIDGELGLLCWQFGEKEVGYWHSVEDGFAGRQPLRSVGPRRYLQ